MDNKVKIHHLITSVQLGGAEVVAYNIIQECNRLYPNRFCFVLLEIFPTNNDFAKQKKKELQNKDIEIISLTRLSKKISLLIAPFKLNQIAKSEKSFIIHSHTDLPDFVLSIALRFKNKLNKQNTRIIRTIHNTVLWPTHKNIGKFVEAPINNDEVVGVSEAALTAYKRLRKEVGLKESISQRVIYNGCPVPINEKIEYKLNSDRINIAICGRFEYQKGSDFIVSFLKKNNKYYKHKIDFIFIGDGSLKDLVKQLQQNETNITVYPPIPGIANKLNVFDYLLMPSRFEGLVLLSIEASLARVPVIASKADGLKDTLPDDWPLFFLLEQETGLKGILNDIITGTINRVHLGEIAFTHASEKFSLTKMVHSYANVYKKLTEK